MVRQVVLYTDADGKTHRYKTKVAAANSLGVSTSTIYRWLRQGCDGSGQPIWTDSLFNVKGRQPIKGDQRQGNETTTFPDVHSYGPGQLQREDLYRLMKVVLLNPTDANLDGFYRHLMMMYRSPISVYSALHDYIKKYQSAGQPIERVNFDASTINH